jgi:hypothetical protein
VGAGLVPANTPLPRRPVPHVCDAAYWDKAFRSLLLSYGIGCAEHVDGRDKPGHDAFEAGAFPRNAPKIRPQPPAHRPGAIKLIAAKPLARLDLSPRHGRCGKQNLG